jgi:multiple sugar transport system substrate-binding protein/sn-glycerol 3-phosphate transport system substrate-binding protein
MYRNVKRLLVFAVRVLVLARTACAPAAPTEQPATEAPAAQAPATEEVMTEEPMAEAPATEEPMAEEPMMDLSGVTVSFWHVYGEGDPRNEAINAIVDDFNSTNEYGITVEALDQGQYSDLEDKVNAGIQSGDLPNIAQAYTSALANWDTVDLVADLNQYIDDPDYGLTADEKADIYASVLDSGVTADGRRIGWPFSQSANVVVYNYTWAQELGFDSAPTTPEEFKAQVCAAADANANDGNPDHAGTGGMVWFPSASNYLSFLHAYGGTELNADGTAYEFNTDAAKQVALYINDLRDNGCTFETESYPNPEQGQRLALVTLSSTSGLPFYAAAFADAGNDDEWGFLPFPGPDGGQGVDAFTQTLGVLKGTPEQDLASWLFIKYLTTPENQATWLKASGYLPTLASVEPLLADYIAESPVYASTFALAALGQTEPETYPAWASVRRAVDDASAQMYAAESPEEIDTILADLDQTAADLVAEIQ